MLKIKRILFSLGNLPEQPKKKQMYTVFLPCFHERQNSLLKIVWLISTLICEYNCDINKEIVLQKSTHLSFAQNKSKGKSI